MVEESKPTKSCRDSVSFRGLGPPYVALSIASRFEAIASRFEAIASRLEAIAIRFLKLSLKLVGKKRSQGSSSSLGGGWRLQWL